jgi:hypothetical protein
MVGSVYYHWRKGVADEPGFSYRKGNVIMKDNSSQEEKLVDTTVKDEGSKEAILPPKGATPKSRSSGKGLYITAIVLGIIIVLLLALYIYLTITHQKASHAFITSPPAITWISKG